MKAEWQIPFNSRGDQVAYPSENTELRPNFEFQDVLIYHGFERGRSAAHMVFKRERAETLVRVFLKEFEGFVPHMRAGKVSGRFTFCKRGQNFGCILLEAIFHEG